MIREAKSRLSQLIAKACRGEEIVIVEGQAFPRAGCVRPANRRGDRGTRVRVNGQPLRSSLPFALRISPSAANPLPVSRLR